VGTGYDDIYDVVEIVRNSARQTPKSLKLLVLHQLIFEQLDLGV
jgi:hypothetical protein